MATILDVVKELDIKLNDAQVISLNGFREMILGCAGTKIASIVTRTTPKMRKKGNPFFGNCLKIAKSNVIINPSDSGYENSVNRQRTREEKEPNFEAEPRLWGNKLTGIPFIAHINRVGEANTYFWVKVERVIWVRYVDSEAKYLDSDEVESYITDGPESTRQGTNKSIVVRNYKSENVIGIFMDGQKFLVDNR